MSRKMMENPTGIAALTEPRESAGRALESLRVAVSSASLLVSTPPANCVFPAEGGRSFFSLSIHSRCVSTQRRGRHGQFSSTLVAAVLILTGLVCCDSRRVYGQRFSGGGNPVFGDETNLLQSLPPIEAVPLGRRVGPEDPVYDALKSPEYCDSKTLRENASIRSLRFWGNEIGIAVGDHGMILTTVDGGRSWSRRESGVECRLNDCIWLDPQRVIAVGGGFDALTRISRGVVLMSNDAGATWRTINETDYPQFTSLRRDDPASARPKIIANSHADPVTGATRFESRDEGRSWQSMFEDQPGTTTETDRETELQIAGLEHRVVRSSVRLDDGIVLCAGDHGSIDRSTDHGETWQSVNGNDTSAAVLVLAGSADRIPWSLIGRETLEKRLRVGLAAEFPTYSDSAVSIAAMRLGVSSVQRLDASDRSRHAEELVRLVRQHRPPILAIDAAFDPELKKVLLHRAVELGSVKVVEYAAAGEGTTLLHDSALLPGSGALAGDFRVDSQLLVAGAVSITDQQRQRPWVAIETRYSQASGFVGGDGLGIGVKLSRQHRLPARESKTGQRRLQVIQGRLKQQAAIKDLFEISLRPDADAVQPFSTALARMLDQTSQSDQFRTVWTIESQSRGLPHQHLVWQEIASRFPEMSAGRLAALRSQAREQSLEWQALRDHVVPGVNSFKTVRSGSPIAAQFGSPIAQDASELLLGGEQNRTIVSPFQQFDSGGNDSANIVQASATSAIPESGLRKASRQGAANSAGGASGPIDLAWQMHPVRLITTNALQSSPNQLTESPESDAAEANGDGLSADLRRIAGRKTEWSGLLSGKSPQVATAVRCGRPPRLDGVLDEPCWNSREAAGAITRDERAMRLRFAWDDRFVYVAVQSDPRFLRPPGNEETTTTYRDADLQHGDRVKLGFDLDRDLMTTLNLSFAADGRTRDDLDGYDRWNPTWYVATDRSDGVVTTEIAIEQSGFADAIEPGEQWFVEAVSLAAGQSDHPPLMPDPRTRVRVDFQ